MNGVSRSSYYSDRGEWSFRTPNRVWLKFDESSKDLLYKGQLKKVRWMDICLSIIQTSIIRITRVSTYSTNGMDE